VWVDLESGTYGTGKIVALDPAQTWAADFANLSDAERIEYASTRGTEMLAEGF
jgi:hypothetical protein